MQEELLLWLLQESASFAEEMGRLKIGNWTQDANHKREDLLFSSGCLNG